MIQIHLTKVLLFISDVVEYSVCINHTQSSTSKASNVRLRWIFPNSLEFHAFNQTLGPELTIAVYSSYVDVKVSKLIILHTSVKIPLLN